MVHTGGPLPVDPSGPLPVDLSGPLTVDPSGPNKRLTEVKAGHKSRRAALERTVVACWKAGRACRLGYLTISTIN